MHSSTQQHISNTQQPCLTTGKHVCLRPAKNISHLQRLLLPVLACLFMAFSSASSAVTEGVGLYIGSFDPPTQGHREIVLRSALKANLKNVYISVNRGGKNSSKDYRWSLGERLSMVRSMFRDTSIRVVVLAEPLEGRVALAHQITELHKKPLRGIFGADTLEKNYAIFKAILGFEYIAVSRPGYELPQLPDGAIVHKLDSPGNISSTNVRKMLSEGVRDIPELHPAVESFIYKNNPLNTPAKGAESAFNVIYVDFQKKIVKQLPALGIEKLPEPAYNPQQTTEGQKEKIIRAVLSLTEKNNNWRVLTRGQQTVETYHRSYPIKDTRKAGFFLGSFDPISKGQIAAINKAIDVMDLKVIYFSPLKESRKPITYPVLDRIAALELIKDKIVVEARILPSRSLLEAVEVVDRLNDRHSGKVVAVFGETVFAANYQRMSKIKGLEFSMLSFGAEAPTNIPLGVTLIKTDASIQGVYDNVTQLLSDRRKKQN
ncbi:MAG: nicotinic acid mononucleotide adenylyltransferase [Granulosicoccus sp.]|jgi:nicotinic acid mononucleotide adenylyltransferase